MGLMRILTDDSEEELRRTPRRVRFGGEIVKMRTPDSDSNQPSDMEGDVTMVVKPWDDQSDQASIQIRCDEALTKKKSSTSKHSRSGIPVPSLQKSKTIRSEPGSPVKPRNSTLGAKKFKSKSSPNLSSNLGEELAAGASRIPRRNVNTIKANIVQGTTIRIDINDASASQLKIKAIPPQEGEGAANKPLEDQESERTRLSERRSSRATLRLEHPRRRRDSDKSYSPIPIHKEIEIFHNLTRSPDRSKSEEELDFTPTTLALPPIDQPKSPRSVSSASRLENKPSSAIKSSNFNPTLALVPYGSIQPTQVSEGTPKLPDASDGETRMRYNSFHVYKDTSESGTKTLKTATDSPIPTNDRGECLTCSSSGSDSHAFDSNWEEADGVNPSIIKHLQCKVS